MRHIKKTEWDQISDILLLTMDNTMVIGIDNESIVLYENEEHYYSGESGLDGINISDSVKGLILKNIRSLNGEDSDE